MDEKSTKTFEQHRILETEMDRLAGEVLRNRELPEMKEVGDREILKQAIKPIDEHREERAQETAPDTGSSSPLPQYTDDASPEIKLEIEYLVDIAFHKGIAAANREAKKSSAYVLDAFHDALTGRLYPELQKRGVLK